MLALPGSAYLYQGEELGLPEHTTLPDEVRQDPAWVRSGHTERGRDGCRVPIPWEADAPSYGFGPADASWLPQPPIWAEYALDRQRGRARLDLRAVPVGAGGCAASTGWARGALAWLDAPARGAGLPQRRRAGADQLRRRAGRRYRPAPGSC